MNSSHDRGKRPSTLSRRGFLAGAGALGATLPFALPMLPSLARADQPEVPRRLVVFWSPNGVPPEGWWPQMSEPERGYTMSTCMKALEPYKDKLLLIRGLDNRSICLEGYGDGHERGMVSVLTGWHMLPGRFNGGSGFAAGPSLDHLVGNHLASQGYTGLPSMQVGIRSTKQSRRNMMTISYEAADSPVYMQNDPGRIFDDVFAGLEGKTPDPKAVARKLRRQSILDHTLADLQGINAQLSAEDRRRLDQYTTHIRDIERSIQSPQNAPLLSCTLPEQLAELDPLAMENYEVVAKAQMDNVVGALACDRTRMAVIQLTRGFGTLPMSYVGHPNDSWHGLSHEKGNKDATRKLQDVNRHVMERFAYLLGTMDAVVEANGKTLLDNSIVLYCNSMNSGLYHNYSDMPFMLAGGDGWLNTGRYLRLQDLDTKLLRCKAPQEDLNHNNLLLTLARYMGLPNQTIGDPRVATSKVIQQILM